MSGDDARQQRAVTVYGSKKSQICARSYRAQQYRVSQRKGFHAVLQLFQRWVGRRILPWRVRTILAIALFGMEYIGEVHHIAPQRL